MLSCNTYVGRSLHIVHVIMLRGVCEGFEKTGQFAEAKMAYLRAIENQFLTLVSHPGFSPRFPTPVSHPGFSPGFLTPVSHPGFLTRFLTRVPHQGSSPGFLTPVSHPGFTCGCRLCYAWPCTSHIALAGARGS